jgi:arginyl-tRNA--protein-N-Asp/Glu arginylyltransferase
MMTRADDGHERRTEALRRTLEDADLEPDAEHPCTYLPGRRARQVLVSPQSFTPGLYHAFMDLNFRRLGFLVYRAACRGCTECRMLRVLVDEFVPTRAQRRCVARNCDLRVAVGRPRATDEKRALYRRYLESRHDGTMSGSAEEMASFLYDAPRFTVEVTYRAGSRLVAVGIADVEPSALSAVYCYFDPAEARRSPGVFNVLTLLEECRERSLPYLYLGYYVAGSPKMAYKSGFRPHEVLGPDGAWARRDR